MVDPDAPGDPGLQAERTRLSWRRLTLSVTVVALLATGRVVTSGARPAAVAGLGLVALGWVALLTVAHRRVRALTIVRRGAAPVGSAAAVVAIVVAALGLVVAVLVV
ncbi:MAG TPA: DUF202 domain-containing protein [Micromonosporaceae bacterium]|jgi:hypothetical protein